MVTALILFDLSLLECIRCLSNSNEQILTRSNASLTTEVSKITAPLKCFQKDVFTKVYVRNSYLWQRDQ